MELDAKKLGDLQLELPIHTCFCGRILSEQEHKDYPRKDGVTCCFITCCRQYEAMKGGGGG